MNLVDNLLDTISTMALAAEADRFISSFRCQKGTEPYEAAVEIMARWGIEDPEWDGSYQQFACRFLAHWCNIDLAEAQYVIDMIVADWLNDPNGVDEAETMPYHWDAYAGIKAGNLAEKFRYATEPFDIRAEVEQYLKDQQPRITVHRYAAYCVQIAIMVAFAAACDTPDIGDRIRLLDELWDECRSLNIANSLFDLDYTLRLIFARANAEREWLEKDDEEDDPSQGAADAQ